jgi:hypothetical protein
MTNSRTPSFFATSETDANDDTMFIKQDKFKEHGYARCGNRIYKVLRITSAGLPVFRKYGEVLKNDSYGSDKPHYSFKHASKPKGIYARDQDGAIAAPSKNYTPCKRGAWWAGTIVTRG